MRSFEFHYCWQWQLQSSPEQFWPLIADTDRFNIDTGLPPVQVQAQHAHGVKQLAFQLPELPGPLHVVWDEAPFEWVYPSRFGVVRTYHSGPLSQMRVRVTLEPQAEGGTHMVYKVWACPRNLLGWFAIPVVIGLVSARRFDKVVRRYDNVSVHTSSTLALPPTQRHFVRGGKQRLEEQRRLLVRNSAPADLTDQLIELLRQADDLTVARLRPYVIADFWGASRREVLELFLLATRSGLLELRWELLCPLCRESEEIAPSLRDIHAEVHCESCNIDYTVNFEQSVELTFRINPNIRPTSDERYCLGGPQVTPHIVLQLQLEPGAREQTALTLGPGRYRLRTRELRGGQSLLVTADTGAAPQLDITITEEGWPAYEMQTAPGHTLTLTNATDELQVVMLERMAWYDTAATAADVTALQRFRDLFTHEALRPGEQIAVGSLTVMFTDLRRSSQLYREVGDATAFGLVMNHFAVLRSAILAQDGAIVKTIGDAVMAIFRRPVAALEAAHQAQAALAQAQGGQRPLQLKVGIHTGSCIAVTLNEQLDYFGSTVNMAARLTDLASGNTLVISDAVYNDPEVAAWIDAEALPAEPFTATLRGFEDDNTSLWRITTDVAAPVLS